MHLHYSQDPHGDSLRKMSLTCGIASRADESNNARALASEGEIPEDVLWQLTAKKGLPFNASNTSQNYRPGGHHVAAWMVWEQRWRVETEEGRADTQRREDLEAERRAAAQAKAIREREDRKIQRAQQEAFRLHKGAAVRVSMPMSRMDGRVGNVWQEMDWDNTGLILMAVVSIDPVPLNSPYRRLSTRCRPIELMPEQHTVRAGSLSREHPEMDL